MKIHKITFMAGMLLILASALIISCSSASEAPPAPTKDSTTSQASNPNTFGIENPRTDVGKDINSFAQRVNLKQQDNAVSCQECDWRGASLVGANLSGADLSGADFSGAKLYLANLSGANLTEADLEEALLKEANLSGADFSGAKLYSANLSGADLSGANLAEADMFGAHLGGVIGADFSGALNLPAK